jgi:hypothetical protein
MIPNSHPTSNELLGNGGSAEDAVLAAHLDECVACRVRSARLRESAGLPRPSLESLARIAEASVAISSALPKLLKSHPDRGPRPGELWRIGHEEAALAWVRRTFDDDAVDVIPVTLDTDMADSESIFVSGDMTPVGFDLVAFVSLRTHLHVGFFLNHVANLNIANDVEEVVSAMREQRPPRGVSTGVPIFGDQDQRIEYRQAIRDIFGDLTPGAWIRAHQLREMGESQSHHEPLPAASEPMTAPATRQESEDWESLDEEIRERLRGARCRSTNLPSRPTVTPLLKVSYLDTAVLVITTDDEAAFAEPAVLLEDVKSLVLIEPDVDAVAIAQSSVQSISDWSAVLLKVPHMRVALEVPKGTPTGPKVTLDGLSLIDTLVKYLDSAVAAWDVTEEAERYLGGTDVRDIAERHVADSLTQIAIEGRRAHQDAKKAWTDLPPRLKQSITAFIEAATHESFEKALQRLELEAEDD